MSPAGGLLFTGPEHGGGGVPSHRLEQRAGVTTAEELRGGTLPPSFLHCWSLFREDLSLRQYRQYSVYLFVAEIGFLFSARRTNKSRGLIHSKNPVRVLDRLRGGENYSVSGHYL